MLYVGNKLLETTEQTKLCNYKILDISETNSCPEYWVLHISVCEITCTILIVALPLLQLQLYELIALTQIWSQPPLLRRHSLVPKKGVMRPMISIRA